MPYGWGPRGGRAGARSLELGYFAAELGEEDRLAHMTQVLLEFRGNFGGSISTTQSSCDKNSVALQAVVLSQLVLGAFVIPNVDGINGEHTRGACSTSCDTLSSRSQEVSGIWPWGVPSQVHSMGTL